MEYTDIVNFGLVIFEFGRGAVDRELTFSGLGPML